MSGSELQEHKNHFSKRSGREQSLGVLLLADSIKRLIFVHNLHHAA